MSRARPQHPVPSVTTTTSEQNREGPLYEDQIRDYRRGQRRIFNLRRRARRLRRSMMGSRYQETLEQEIDPQTTLRLSMQERARLVPAEVLYRSRRDTVHHRVYTHRSEESVLCVGGSQVDRAFIQPESLEQLQRTGMSFIHIGILQVRIQILHRQEEGTMALVVFRDNRWSGDQSIFAQMEIDLTKGSQLVFVIPDTMMTIGDFARNVQLSILTRGYENWQNGEANLLITRGMTGRLSNTPNVAFAYQIASATDYLASHGVKAIAGKKMNLQHLRNQQWILRPPQTDITPMQPRSVETRNLVDGSISIRFHDYEAATSASRPHYNEEDEEVESETESEIREHTIAVWIGEEEIPDQTGRKKVWEESSNGNGRFFRYYTPPPTFEGQIIATGWGSDDDNEKTPPKWDESPDEEGPTEPIWDQEEEEDEYDPNVYRAYLQKEEDEWQEITASLREEMEYPKRRPQTEMAFSETVDYTPPGDTMMTPVGYPPASSSRSTVTTPSRPPLFEGRTTHVPRFLKRDEYTEWWQLPSSQGTTGALFVMPKQMGLFHEVFSRWESITKNYVAAQGFTDPTEKMEFMENLLGETEKLTWIQWRMNYEAEYQQLLTQADGRQGTQNILSQIKRIFSLEDPASGSTRIQDAAYRDLERLTCHNIKDIVQFLNDYGRLAAKSGRLFLGTELSEKLWMKMPPELGHRMKEAFQKEYSGNEVGVFPRILFAYRYLEQECKDAAFKRSLKSLSFCKDMPLTGYYDKTSKYGMRKSRTYKGKPHASHARVEKRKHLIRNKKCKCYLCGDEGHFARECPNQRRDVKRVAIFEGIDLPEGFDIVSVEEGEEESDAIYSISENEDGELDTEVVHEKVFMMREEDQSYWLGKTNHWTAMVRVSSQQYHCMHQWEHNKEILVVAHINCHFCKQPTQLRSRIHCPTCQLTSCFMCAPIYCNMIVQQQPKPPVPFNTHTLLQQQAAYIQWLEKENQRLTEAVEFYKKEAEELRLERDLEQDRRSLEPTLLDKGKKVQILDPDEDQHTAYLEEDTISRVIGHTVEQQEVRKPVKKGNMLYNLDVVLHIPEVGRPIKVKAILDTGATTCCININSVPQTAIEQNTFLVQFRGINSTQSVDKKLKYGRMTISNHQFRIPYCYAFPLSLGDGIEMILGCNFIRGMYGGLRIEGHTITFYKNVTTIQTRLAAVMVGGTTASELGGGEESKSDSESMFDLSETEEFDSETHQQIVSHVAAQAQQQKLDPKLQQLMVQLQDQGFIGENPMQHWAKNKILCRLDIKNPDLIIEDKPIKHLTPAMEKQFQKHIKALLDIGVIRPSKSKHRTTAFIVESGTVIDPVTKKTIHGKERLVFNYKRLNDNTEKDQYSLPGIQTILKRVGNKKVFSKFDLKSGFHQVAMAEESIPWTAFWVPQGLYEWLVMPFGLKNAPAVFQRKMDQCFKGTEEFIAVYIDDILVFSENMAEHTKHIGIMLKICQENGLVLSPSKICLAQREIEFLGTVISQGQMKLQAHVIKKIVNKANIELETTKGLRSFLGLLNYARIYIPNLGRKLSPLYAKTSPTGEKRFNRQDWHLIKEIKDMVQKLPNLAIPPARCYIIIESDGCMEGWGAVCKWKLAKEDSRTTEKICAYASGKFGVVKSTIDAEIYALIKALESFKIFYLDKKHLVVRTDCQAIVTFYNKTSTHKPSRIRWITFSDYITGLGVPVTIEHIDGKENQLADTLSRLVYTTWNQSQTHQPEEEELEKSQHLSFAGLAIPIAWPMMGSYNKRRTPLLTGQSLWQRNKPSQHSSTASKSRQPRKHYWPYVTYRAYSTSRETIWPLLPLETTGLATDCQLPNKTQPP
ncbi:polyprotein [Cacao swollen shoot Togo B virus]|uniref:RNA-directed DNA polymerase n=8 Tax=Badnavirus etainflatheobromae TaxID=3047713 RepID=Q66233_9VIRU|nr:polyprotein [Cacao swollen shoot virus]AAA03171.1 polyprotein [Cacao swollen shoot virus]